MRVMVLIKATPRSEAGALPSEALLTEMGRFNEALAKADVLVDGDGLQPSSKGKRVRFSAQGEQTVVDGPFLETDTLVAGYWIWNVASMEDAVAWARRCPHPMPGEDAEIELRPFFEAEDLGEAFTPELRAREAELREEIEKRRA